MAEIVTVKTGDTVNGLLMRKKGIGHHQAFQWVKKVETLNPHISDPNRIFAGDKILIPANLQETVSPTQVWQNVFSHIPAGMNGKNTHQITLCEVQPGDTIDAVAAKMFEGGPYNAISHSAKRAVLLHNNPVLKNKLKGSALPVKMLLDVTPIRQSQMDQQFWNSQQSAVQNHLNRLDPALLDFYRQQGPERTNTVAEAVKRLKGMGAGVGMGDAVKGGGYLAVGASSYATAGTKALMQSNALAKQLYDEAVKTLGKNVVVSKKAGHIAQMEKFLKSHAKFKQLMQNLKDLPRWIIPKDVKVPMLAAQEAGAVARKFRKSYVLPFDKWNSGRYFSSAAKRLKSNLSIFKGAGNAATWYVPAAIGLYETANAPEGRKMRELFGQGFSVLGGYAGTVGGLWVANTLAIPATIHLMVLAGLCLGPFGMFVIVVVCTGFLGYMAMNWGKDFGYHTYDIGSQLGNGKTYHSIEQLLKGL